MPNYIGYIEKDPSRRGHIFEWTSKYATLSAIQAEAGVGYFIKRLNKHINIVMPPAAYDGDVVTFIDATPEASYEKTEHLKVTIEHPEHKIMYNYKLYDIGEGVELDYLAHYQQYFMYVASINTWVGSYVRLDSALTKPLLAGSGLVYYGVCEDIASTAVKTVYVDTAFSLHLGAHIRVLFNAGNKSDNMSINVNGSGEYRAILTMYKPITPNLISPGQVVDFTFTGTEWIAVHIGDPSNTSTSEDQPSTPTPTPSPSPSPSNGLTADQVEKIIAAYLVKNNITGVSNSRIKQYIDDYFKEHGISGGSGSGGGGLSAADVTSLIANYILENNIGSGGGGSSGGGATINEAQINNLIARYIRDNNIGTGNNGLTTSQVNVLIENYYNEHKGSGKGITFCTSSTSETTVDKFATISDGSTFELKVGASVRVHFSYAQKASEPRLNVANTGAKAIKIFGQNAAQADQWKAGEVIDFVYDGSVWYIVDGSRKQDAIDFVSSSDSIQQAVNAALQGNIEAMIDNKTANTIAALNAQVDAKIEAMEGSVASSIETLRGDVNTTIEGFRTEVGQTRTQLEQSIQSAITTMQGQIADEIAAINLSINDTISTAFDESIDEKIQENFTNVVQQQINTATANLEASITQLRTDLTNNVNVQIENMTSTINTKIAEFESQFANETRQLRDSIATMIAAQFTETINQRIDEAFTATIDAKIMEAFEGAEGTLNTAIAAYQQSINQQFAEIRSSVGDDIRNMREYMEGQLTAFQAQIEETVSTTFDNAIDQKIQQNLSTHIHQIIQSEFITSIDSIVNDKVTELDTKIQADIKKAVDDFDAKVKAFTDTIDQRIAAHYTQHIEQDIGALRTQLRNEITAAVNSLEGTIDQKLENKFNSTIDTLMENKFSAMIDTKIEQGFDTRITAKVNEAKTEIMNSIDDRIDAKIRAAIDGEITTLINTKLEDYIAPAIGALY